MGDDIGCSQEWPRDFTGDPKKQANTIMKTRHKLKLVIAVLSGVVALTTTLRAQEAATNAVKTTEPSPSIPVGSPVATAADPWRFDFAIIGWGPAVTGDVTVRGRKANVDLGLDELLDH